MFGWVGSLHRQIDWTDGCITVTNEEIDEIWPVVAVGMMVEIRPRRVRKLQSGWAGEVTGAGPRRNELRRKDWKRSM